MLKKIAIGLAVLVLGFIVVVAVQPSTFHIERSHEIEAPSYLVFNLINNFHRWPTWSPWEKLDPSMQRKHSGPEAGVGASYEWSGNDQVGEGRMTISESVPSDKVGIQLEFMKPWEATNTTLFTLHQKGPTTKVTWAMKGNNDFMAKAASLFMDMDALVGKDFEAGLKQLGTIAEREAREIERAKAEQVKRAEEQPFAEKAEAAAGPERAAP